MSKNTYIATVMQRHYVGEDTFIFTCLHAVLGELDEKTNIFRDRNGNEYVQMLDEELIKTEIPYSYSNIMRLDQLKESFGQNLSLNESISEYEYLAKGVIYYVSTLDDGKLFTIPLEIDKIRQNTTEQLKNIESQTKDNINSQKISQEQEKYTEYLGSNEDIETLTNNVISGVYSLEELKQLREQFEAIEGVIDTLDLQIEATEKGESSVRLKGEKEKNSSNNRIPNHIKNYIDIKDLYNKITKTLIAQDTPTRRVITELARKEQSNEAKARGILLTGPTGVGKTKMMQLIAKYLERPLYKLDATKLTIPGYVGTDIEEELWKLYVECGYDLETAEHAIIFIDEIDKKGSGKKDDVSGKGVLNILLPFIEGAEYDAVDNMKSPTRRVKINTKNMIVFLGGAYTDVYKNLVDKNMGFCADISQNNTPRPATISDFVDKAQMTDEFMGRVAIVKLNDLSVDDLVKVITESDESSLEIQKKIFKELGVKLTAGDDFVRKIAQNAFDRKTGARGLNTIVEEATWEAYYDAYTNPGKYSEMILNKETVEDPKKYQKINR